MRSKLCPTGVAGETTGLKETYLKYLYSCNYSQWKDDIINDYKEYAEVMKLVEGADIANHEIIEKGINKTTYSNGTVIYVNYTDNAYQAEDGTIIEANSYVAERGE